VSNQTASQLTSLVESLLLQLVVLVVRFPAALAFCTTLAAQLAGLTQQLRLVLVRFLLVRAARQDRLFSVMLPVAQLRFSL
jgi:hypothetical protein